MKVALVIAGGKWQVALIKKLRQCGFSVACVNLHKDSPGFDFSDYRLVSDIRNVSEIQSYAQEVRPSLVVSDQSDIAVRTVAAVAEHLRLPSIGSFIADRFSSKPEMRKFCRAFGQPTPGFAQCTNLQDVKAFMSTVSGKVLIKPIDSQGSRGVRILTDVNVESAFNEAMAYSSLREVLVEEFIGGTEYTVEGIQHRGQHHILAVGRKKHFTHNPVVAEEILYAFDHPEINSSLLSDQHNKLIETMGLPFGITHSEYKFSDGDFYLIETAARGGGNNISSHIVPWVSGFDSQTALIEMSRGNNDFDISVRPAPRFALLKWYELPFGRVVRINGLSQARNASHILDIGLNFREGDYLCPVADDTNRHMYTISIGNTEFDARQIAESAVQLLSIDIDTQQQLQC